ncbi:hypothetical protein GBN28_03465 [Plesiomonas shigelloides]|nr:hypothetical protein GBN23_11580 [Plesiomonas shigelloides]KAB7691767.1 hypothetical protein GBN28_03465 [Plesiomonas shigelloides]
MFLSLISYLLSLISYLLSLISYLLSLILVSLLEGFVADLGACESDEVQVIPRVDIAIMNERCEP